MQENKAQARAADLKPTHSKVGGNLAVVQLLLELVELCNMLLHGRCFLCSTLSLLLAFTISLFEPVNHSIRNQESLF